MKFGDFNIHFLSDGTIRLDGGAMFGVVPKVMWEKICPADELNRIELGLNQLLIQAADNKNILINTGIGGKFDEKYSSIYGINRTKTMLDCLQDIGIPPSDIDAVIATHLHFDHNGGSTHFADNGSLQLTFPNAEYFIQRAEWEDATHPHERNKASYLAENIEPLSHAKKLTLIDGDAELFPGIEVRVTGGHTRAHQVVLIHAGQETLIYWSDLIPTSGHVQIPYIMGYDLYPMDTIRMKKELLDEAVAGNWLCFWEHEIESMLGRIRKGDKGYWVEKVMMSVV